MSDINIKKEILIEDQPNAVPIEGIKKILFQLENCICQIYKKVVEKELVFLLKYYFKINYYQY